MDNKYSEMLAKNPLFKPNYWIYLATPLTLGAILAYLSPITIPLVQIALIASYKWGKKRYSARINSYTKYLQDMVENVEKDNHYAVAHMQVGIGVFGPRGLLQWYNEKFQEILQRQQIFGYNFESLLPVNKGFFRIISTQEQVIRTISIEGRIYTMQTRRMVDKTSKDNSTNGVSIYLYDITELTELRQKYTDNKLALCYVRCDNYDEVVRSLSDSGIVLLNGTLSGMLTKWVKTNNGFIVHLSNALALIGFNHKAMGEIVKSRFDILDKAHTINAGGRMNPTLSMGIAMTGESLNDQLEKASDALDMALNRGGDQVVVNNYDHLNYFGATGAVYTKANRVRARIVAQTLRDQMEKAGHILVMGHKNEDYDALGAAVGIAAMARFLKKPVHILLSDTGGEYKRSKDIIASAIPTNPYDDLTIFLENDIQQFIKSDTLLILVDHHRQVLSAFPEIVKRVSQRALIDHHRRSEDMITDLGGVYQEPSSSSTSEMVTELLPYFDEDMELTPYEATKLYLGILLDSKNFTTQTNERTFEAAAYLRRFGADIALANEIFADNFNDLKYRSKLIAEAQFPLPGFAVAINHTKDHSSHMGILASQTADELINTTGIHGSCVITQYDDTDSIHMNARSDGKVFNVQVIMEALGGGGHQNMAACQINGKTLEEATKLLLEEIKKQLEE